MLADKGARRPRLGVPRSLPPLSRRPPSASAARAMLHRLASVWLLGARRGALAQTARLGAAAGAAAAAAGGACGLSSAPALGRLTAGARFAPRLPLRWTARPSSGLALSAPAAGGSPLAAVLVKIGSGQYLTSSVAQGALMGMDVTVSRMRSMEGARAGSGGAACP